MPVTLTQATTALQAWIEADSAVATGQSYTIGARSLTRADADEITSKINYWSNVEAGLQRIAAGGTKTSVSLAKF